MRLFFSVLFTVIIAGCATGDNSISSKQVYTVSNLLKSGTYEKVVEVRGVVSRHGQLNCTCFMITSGNKSIKAWYDMMVTGKKIQLKKVDVSNVKNGKSIMLKGVLKNKGPHNSKNDFWIYKLIR